MYNSFRPQLSVQQMRKGSPVDHMAVTGQSALVGKGQNEHSMENPTTSYNGTNQAVFAGV